MRSAIYLASLLAGVTLAGVSLAQRQPDATANPLQKAAVGPVSAAGSGHAQFGAFGIDTAGMDTAVTPGNDFYQYVNGTWQKDTTIPSDQAGYGMFEALQDLSLQRTRTILETAERDPSSKIGNYYASFLDQATVDAKGDRPIKPWLDAIAGATDRTALLVQMAKLQRMGVGGLFGVGVGQDDKAPDSYIVHVRQSGIGLPDRDYYLKDDPKLAAVRTAYQAYLAKMLTLAGEADATTRAQAVYGFEQSLATAHWTRVESRDADKTYNRWTAADFAAKAPGVDWATYEQALGVAGQGGYLVAQPSAISGEAKAFAATPLPVLKDYLTLCVLRGYASFLATPFDQANFAFYGTTLSGTPEQRPRWKRAVSIVDDGMGEAVGKIYVANYFPPKAKAEADQLVHNLVAAMNRRIDGLDWMAPETKRLAHAKLAAFTPQIGYPSHWRDYSALVMKRDDLVGNKSRAEAFDWQRNLNKLGHPVDRSEWFMTPMEINAYANPTMDEVVFPAAILQPPFFDPDADPAVNYGGIGAVIGHEMSHHFDDQGRKYDATGRLHDWWTAEDVKRFTAATDKLVAQYSGYEPIPGQHIQGALTLGENIADLSGLTIAYDAYHASLGGKAPPVVDGRTGDQRFFMGWAQVWRTKDREASMRQALLSDPHSPGAQRAWTVRNLDAWYAAFKVDPGATMYLAPADRVRIW